MIDMKKVESVLPARMPLPPRRTARECAKLLHDVLHLAVPRLGAQTGVDGIIAR